MTISDDCRHVEIDRHRPRHLDRRAGDRAGDAELVHVDGELLRAGEHDDRRAADHDRDRHRLAPRAVLEPVQIAAGAGRLARHHAHGQPVGRFQRRAIGAHVLDAALGIVGDAERRGQIGRGIEARRRDRHRQAREPAAGLGQLVAGEHHLLAARRMRPAPARPDWRSPASRPRRSPPPAAPCRSRRSRAKPRARRPPPACRSAGPWRR